MPIKNIAISNFKTFEEQKINLEDFNILIGANSAGKSNFIQFFKFLRDIVDFGLNNAIYMQGGIEYLRNANLPKNDKSSFQIDYELPNRGFAIAQKPGYIIILENPKITYKFILKYRTKSSYEVIEDNLSCIGVIAHLPIQGNKIDQKNIKKYEEGKIEIINNTASQRVKVTFTPPQGLKTKIKEKEFFPVFLGSKLKKGELLLESSFYIPPLKEFLHRIAIYDFDPRLSKRATQITGKIELEEDGGNLASVLKSILDNTEKRRKFKNYLQDLLPFVENIRLSRFADRSLLIKTKEIGSNYLPAPLISDGTINIIALLVVLYFENRELIILEEPERNIHPFLISKIIDLFKEASKKKQIIITTHNPEIIRHSDFHDIYLISRNTARFSEISRPIEKEKIQKFLENEIGIDELYVQNLLGV
jgi:predicted ATPase